MDRRPLRSYNTSPLSHKASIDDNGRSASRDYDQSLGRDTRQIFDDRRERHRRDRDNRGSRDRDDRFRRDYDDRSYRDRDSRRYRETISHRDREERDYRDDRGYRRDDREYRESTTKEDREYRRRESHDRWNQRDRENDQLSDQSANANMPAKPVKDTKPKFASNVNDKSNIKLDVQEKDTTAGEKHEEEEDDAAAQMARLMGFSSFDSSKGKKGVDVSGVARTKTSSFRQYMNRDKGFNRELSPPPAERRQK